MKERGILFNAEMVRAVLAGRKTQTRRIARFTASGHLKALGRNARWHREDPGAFAACPYGQPGDRLWVRETFGVFASDSFDIALKSVPYGLPTGYEILYRATDGDIVPPGAWMPSSHMPRWASRITLEVTGVRVERVRDISEADAECEGAEPATPPEATGARYKPAFRHLWDSVNAARGYGWDVNPWVWVVEFRRVEA